jgi:hypothetical protein
MTSQDKTERNTSLPGSFRDAMLPNYLGNPSCVEGILKVFIGNMLDCIESRSQGSMTAADMVAWMRDDAARFSLIFSGEDSRYVAVRGWNSREAGLSSYLKVDLSHYWVSQRKSHDDDPFKVAHAWLLWAIFDSLKKNDDDVTALVAGAHIQTFVRLLTGTAARR